MIVPLIAGERIKTGSIVRIEHGKVFNMPGVCGRCGEMYDLHIQGRCPPDVELNERAFAKAALWAIAIIVVIVIVVWLRT